MTYFLGKRPATTDSRDIKLSESVSPTALPKVPKLFPGYANDFTAGYPGWSMLGNGPVDDGSIPSVDTAASQGAGDCEWAGRGHEIMLMNKNAKRTVPKFTSLNILEQYSQYSGYNLITGANDNGTDVREGLQWCQSKGLIDVEGTAHKVGIFVSLSTGNLQELLQALYIFDVVGMGIEFPESAMTQFNEGKEWVPVKGSQIDGGHYIPIVAHPKTDVWTCITWGQPQTLSNNFITEYCDELWAYITPERYNSVTGESPQSYTDYDLEKFIKLLPAGNAS